MFAVADAAGHLSIADNRRFSRSLEKRVPNVIRIVFHVQRTQLRLEYVSSDVDP
jgi:hypothetical protein